MKILEHKISNTKKKLEIATNTDSIIFIGISDDGLVEYPTGKSGNLGERLKELGFKGKEAPSKELINKVENLINTL